ncbi:hypothetical protein STAS_29318 [Striga asiatica]|uniref:Uncharacterized protein n=1 Tax=Striga asiatica TaxID=4170 RepID=A0A5A7R6L8_STRAF|nr:hypothetical protein STAS_29318 [Striga asiatica]
MTSSKTHQPNNRKNPISKVNIIPNQHAHTVNIPPKKQRLFKGTPKARFMVPQTFTRVAVFSKAIDFAAPIQVFSCKVCRFLGLLTKPCKLLEVEAESPGVESSDEARYNTAMHAIDVVRMRNGDLGFVDFAFGLAFGIAILGFWSVGRNPADANK